MKKPRIHFHIITLFPESFEGFVSSSILGRAQAAGHIAVSLYNPRDFTRDKHRRVDSRPYGGGPGMVLQAPPLLAAVKKARGRKKSVITLILSPSGEKFTNRYARTLATPAQHIILIAGHYEGIDARVKKILKAREVSIGDYILTGGELPAAVIIDAVSRHIPGVLGNENSPEEGRAAGAECYTRPDVLEHGGKKYRVPRVLLSGDHKKIDAWRAAAAGRRP